MTKMSKTVPLMVLRSAYRTKEPHAKMALAVREYVTNFIADSVDASRALITEVVIDGVRGLLTSHNGTAFDSGEHIYTSLHFNNTGGEGAQGGGMKAASAVLPVKQKGVYEFHLASKTKLDGFQSRSLVYRSNARVRSRHNETVTPSEIGNSEYLDENTLRTIYGPEYDEYTVFMFVPLKTLQGKKNRHLNIKFMDVLSLALDGLEFDTEIDVILRAGKEKGNKGHHAGTKGASFPDIDNPIQGFSGAGYRETFIPRLQKLDDIIPSLINLSGDDCMSVEVELEQDDELRRYRVDVDLRLNVAFSEQGADEYERMVGLYGVEVDDEIVPNEKWATFNQYLPSACSARVVFGSDGEHAPQFDRCYQSPMNMNESVTQAFLNKCMLQKVTITNQEAIKSIWKDCGLEDIDTWDYDVSGIKSCKPIVDARITITPLNSDAKLKFHPEQLVDVLFLVKDREVLPIIRKAITTALDDQDPALDLFLDAFNKHFRPETKGLVSLPVNGNRNAAVNRDAIKLWAVDTVDGESPNYTFYKDKSNLTRAGRDNSSFEVYLTDEDGVFFTDDIILDTVSDGYKLRQDSASKSDEEKGRPVLIKAEPRAKRRVRNLFFNARNEKRYVVHGVWMESTTTRHHDPDRDIKVNVNPEGEDKPGNTEGEKKAEGYIHLDDPYLLGIYQSGTVLFNSNNPEIKHVFNEYLDQTSITNAQTELATEIREIGHQTHMRMDRFDIEWAQGVESDEGKCADSQEYLFNDLVLRPMFEAGKEKIERKIEKLTNSESS